MHQKLLAAGALHWTQLRSLQRSPSPQLVSRGLTALPKNLTLSSQPFWPWAHLAPAMLISIRCQCHSGLIGWHKGITEINVHHYEHLVTEI